MFLCNSVIHVLLILPLLTNHQAKTPTGISVIYGLAGRGIEKVGTTTGAYLEYFCKTKSDNIKSI